LGPHPVVGSVADFHLAAPAAEEDKVVCRERVIAQEVQLELYAARIVSGVGLDNGFAADLEIAHLARRTEGGRADER